MKKPKGYVSPLERIKNQDVRRRVDEKKSEIYLSTLIVEEMAKHGLTVRKLAKCAKVSPTTIQSIRAGAAENIGLAKLELILGFMGRTIAFPPIRRTASRSARACP